MLLARLIRVIIYETQHTKSGRDWPVKHPNRRSGFPGPEITDEFKLESIVELGCAEHGAASEGGVEGVEDDGREYRKGYVAVFDIPGVGVKCDRES